MLITLLEKELRRAVSAVLPDVEKPDVRVQPCQNPEFGDYQTNSLMSLAKARGLNPRQLACDVKDRLSVQDWCESVEVAGPGFLNFRLRPEAVIHLIATALKGDHLFFTTQSPAQRVVIDFSSPNVAKPMHVGHIRSTILGDCLARVYRLLGHQVITDNHIGDWGTQFGKLIVGWKEQLDTEALERDPLAEMDRLYKDVHQRCENDPALLEQARQELVKLQQGDPENLEIWRRMTSYSQDRFAQLYKRLGVKFDFSLGESFYQPHLEGVVQELLDRGIAQYSEGAVVVFFEDHPELAGQPAIIRKRDGGFNYATTDLATLAYRLENWKPGEIVYVTDGRQQLHFKQVFEIFRRWHPEARIKLTHVWFGAILGEDGRPFKTRSGETVKLSDLLEEAKERAYGVVSEKNPELGESRKQKIAECVGIGAIKYADLLPNRQSDYIFSWDRMLSLNGNTAPYLLYAYTRIRSIFRKLREVDPNASLKVQVDPAKARLAAQEEWVLAKQLLNFGFVLKAVAEDYRPNYLCNYLYDLAGQFAKFYETCPVLKASEEEREVRLALCELTGRVLKLGLETLGIETIERM